MNNSSLDYQQKTLLQRLNWQDWLYALVVFVGSMFAYVKYAQYMDIYETVFLFGAAALASYLGWQWKALAKLVLAVGVISLFSISLYSGDQAKATQLFLLKFLISSHSVLFDHRFALFALRAEAGHQAAGWFCTARHQCCSRFYSLVYL